MPFVRPEAALRRLLLPLLLLLVSGLALGGLMVLSPGGGPARVDVVAYRDTPPVPLPALAQRELLLEREAARASRSRVRAEAKAAQLAAEAAAAAAAQAAAEEAARAQAAAEAAAAAAAAEAEAEAAAERKKAEAERKQAEAEAAAAKQKEAAAPSSGGSACPVPAASFTDTYGAPRSGGRSHAGTDLLAPLGTPVYAVVSGRVRTASSSFGGISLYLDGDNGETYFYAHNSANVASSGARVAAGDLIAKVGSTGNAGGTNHVHFERQVDGRSVNPYDFLRRLC